MSIDNDNLISTKSFKHNQELLDIATEVLNHESTAATKKIDVQKIKEEQLRKQKIMSAKLLKDKEYALELKKKAIKLKQKKLAQKKLEEERKQQLLLEKRKKAYEQANKSLAKKVNANQAHGAKVVFLDSKPNHSNNKELLENTTKISYTLHMDALTPEQIQRQRKKRISNVHLSINSKFKPLNAKINNIYLFTNLILITGVIVLLYIINLKNILLF